MSARGMWILFGGLRGRSCGFKRLFVIWPRQQRSSVACWAVRGPRRGRAPGALALQIKHVPLGPDAVGHDRGTPT